LNFLSLFAKQIELAITIADLFQAVKEQAVTDSMTGLFNRRYFEEFIKKEAIRAERQNQHFTVIGLDLDHLKQINDVYGHNYGDIAIKAIAEVLKNNARSIDIAARMGGEEFNLILPGVDSAGGLVAAERIRKAIEGVELEKIGHITASVGVATYLEHSDDLDELLELTDQAMYESKRKGRNRVTLAKPASETSWQDIAIKTYIDILTKHRIPVDETTSKLLTQKLCEINVNNEKLYQVADALVSTYNPDHNDGSVKQKVQLATLLAKRFDLSKEQIDKLKIAILLYDIGNTMLPKDLLNKTSPLSEEDKASIMQHPVLAAREILKPISTVTDIIPIIEKHHENWNGTGYPNHISGDEIPIESQIILIIDSYFALLEKRPYRDANTKETALKIMTGEINSKWSEKLAHEFISIVKNDLD
jgi:diguanylate cyclase (GGDEF)-like protein